MPKKTLTTLAICIGVLACFGLFMLLPLYRGQQVVAEEITELSAQLEQQKVLFPVFEKLLKRAQTKAVEPVLPFPDLDPMRKEDTGRISQRFQQIAVDYGFKLDSVLPDADSLKEESTHLKVNVTASGSFRSLRDWLIALGGLPYLAHIETIRVTTTEAGKQVHLRLWLAQKPAEEK